MITKGQKLGNRYQIEDLLGSGATANVFRAQDTRLDREVAVKVLLPHVHPSTRQRFEREGRAAGMLNHPGIMQMYDIGQEGEQMYLVCELVPGRPLHDLIPAAPETVTDLTIKILAALEYIHSMGLIHRDIKPANIYTLPDSSIKIMDLGLALSLDLADKRLTAVGSIIGTPAYLSPEQAQGKKLDTRTDLYSLAIVMYELLTGALPFDADDISAILIQQVSKAPVPPRELRPEIPAWLEAVILRALEKQPAARYDSAKEMAAALASADAGAEANADALFMPRTITSPGVAPVPPPRIRVALVDDHVILRRTLAAMLVDDSDLEIVGEGSNGQDAIDLVNRIHPQVLLLDLNMPKMPGLVALPIIKREAPGTFVIVLTGRDEASYIMQALRAGANGYMLKTSSDRELIQAVHDVLGGNIVLGQGVAERIVQGLQMMNETDPLTEEERDVVRAIASGSEENAQIAQALGWTDTQVARVLLRTLDKLGVSSRTDAALKALRAGWITVEEIRA